MDLRKKFHLWFLKNIGKISSNFHDLLFFVKVQIFLIQCSEDGLVALWGGATGQIYVFVLVVTKFSQFI